MTTRNILPIAAYHAGPYRIAYMLQDPYGKHTANSGASMTQEVGVLNDDPTARRCKAAIENASMSISEALPLNALPWIDGKPTVSQLREGAEHNRKLIIDSGVKLVVLAGKAARDSEKYLNLPSDIEVRYAPHPAGRGLSNHHRGGRKLSFDEAKEAFMQAFLPIEGG